ncbi:MAG: hypothetical protein AAFQ42_14095 [Pseudomonadota bacterium]
MLVSTSTYVALLVPIIACGGAMSRLMIEIVRREASKRRVERALLAFWLCFALLLSVHTNAAFDELLVRF